MGMPENKNELYNTAKEVLEELLSLMGLTGTVLPSDEFTVTDENGKLLAHGTSTLMILPGQTLTMDRPMPPKFNV